MPARPVKSGWRASRRLTAPAAGIKKTDKGAGTRVI